MFKKLIGKPPDPPQSAKIDWRNSESHLDLLTAFIKPQEFQHVLGWGKFKDVFPADTGKEAIKLLTQEGALEFCPLDVHIEKLFAVDDIKQALSAKSQLTTGKKNILAARWLETDLDGVKKAIGARRVLRCTAIGLSIAEEWERGREAREKKERLAKNRQYFRETISQYKASNIQRVKVMNVSDSHVCDACKELASTTYSIDKVPALPYAKCTCEMGCRCFIRSAT